MKTFKHGNCIIHIREVGNFPQPNTDSKSYNKIIPIEESEFNRCFEFEVEKSGESLLVLLIASYYTPEIFAENHKDGLFLMLNDELCIFNPETISIEKQVNIAPLGTMFEVHSYGKDYILYGEGEIYCVSENLDVKWCFSGRDIFVRCESNEPAFYMKKDKICLYDFQDYYYEIGYDGKLITDKKVN